MLGRGFPGENPLDAKARALFRRKHAGSLEALRVTRPEAVDLVGIKVSTADKILFVADGARWIWNRVGALRRRLGVKPDQVNELVDFYYALEHLGKIAALQRHWTAAERQAWIGRQRRCLRKGGAEDLQRYLSSDSRSLSENSGPKSTKPCY